VPTNCQSNRITTQGYSAAYISAMIQQELERLVIVSHRGQVQRRAATFDRIHGNTLGQQQPHNLDVPCRHRLKRWYTACRDFKVQTKCTQLEQEIIPRRCRDVCIKGQELIDRSTHQTPRLCAAACTPWRRASPGRHHAR